MYKYKDFFPEFICSKTVKLIHDPTKSVQIILSIHFIL